MRQNCAEHSGAPDPPGTGNVCVRCGGKFFRGESTHGGASCWDHVRDPAVMLLLRSTRASGCSLLEMGESYIMVGKQLKEMVKNQQIKYGCVLPMSEWGLDYPGPDVWGRIFFCGNI